MQMMEEVSEHVGMNYPEFLDSRYVAKIVDDFVFPCEEEGSVENPIPSKRLRKPLSQELQSANHQENHQRWRQAAWQDN